MDYRDFTKLLIKMVGAALIFWYLAALPAAIAGALALNVQLSNAQLAAPDLAQGIMFNLLQVVLPLALAIFIFLFPGVVTNRLVRGAPLTNQPQFLTALQVAVLRLVGVFYVFRCLVDLVFYVARVSARDLVQLGAYGTHLPDRWTAEDMAGVACTLVQIALALWLALGARGFIGIIERLRGDRADTPDGGEAPARNQP